MNFGEALHRRDVLFEQILFNSVLNKPVMISRDMAADLWGWERKDGFELMLAKVFDDKDEEQASRVGPMQTADNIKKTVDHWNSKMEPGNQVICNEDENGSFIFTFRVPKP